MFSPIPSGVYPFDYRLCCAEIFFVSLIYFWFVPCVLVVYDLKISLQDQCQGAFSQLFLLEVLPFQAPHVGLLLIFS